MNLRKIIFLSLILVCNISFASEQINKEDYLKQNQNDVILGDKDAPVTLVEYSSLSCPHCAYFHKKIFETIKEKYIDKGKVKYIHRDYPLDKVAFNGSVLAHCSGEKYYLFLKILFEKQENWVFQKNYMEILENIGKLGGISGEKFHQCLNDKKIEEHILNSRLIATNQLDIKATPSFFINQDKYVGMQDLEVFIEKIEEILSKKE